MGEGYAEYLKRVEEIELQHSGLRVVKVFMPCDVPDALWNVEAAEVRAGIPLTGKPIPGLRRGIFGTFAVEKGPFSVKFSDGSELRP